MVKIEGCPCEEECGLWGGCLQTREALEIAGGRVYCPFALARRAKLAEWIKTNADGVRDRLMPDIKRRKLKL